MKRTLLTLAAIALLASSCSNGPDVDQAFMVSNQDFEGVLVNDEAAMPSDQEGAVFLPTSLEAETFEKAMASSGHLEFDPKEEVTEWWRVYAGYEDLDGVRHLVVQGNCTDRPVTMSDATTDDGGRCYWHASYDLSSDEMNTFGFNGAS